MIYSSLHLPVLCLIFRKVKVNSMYSIYFKFFLCFLKKVNVLTFLRSMRLIPFFLVIQVYISFIVMFPHNSFCVSGIFFLRKPKHVEKRYVFNKDKNVVS